MNIFYLDENPKIAASYMVDRHIIKMGLESVQMMCTAHRILDVDENHDHLYKKCHDNHKCNVWLRQSHENYMWLWEHAQEIFKIFSKKGKQHKSETLMEFLQNPPNNMPKIPFTTPAFAFPDEFKIFGDAVECYREYYKKDKLHLKKYTYNTCPDWWS